MKTARAISVTVMALSIAAVGAIATAAEHKSHSSMAKGMAHDPHHALAMAYHHNLETFTKALRDQTAGTQSVNPEFARAAVAEMRRSLDQMKQHRQQCMQAMSAEMQAKMKAKMEQMGPHETQVTDQLAALEQEVQLATPESKNISKLASSIVAHLDAMSKMHHRSGGGKMKKTM